MALSQKEDHDAKEETPSRPEPPHPLFDVLLDINCCEGRESLASGRDRIQRSHPTKKKPRRGDGASSGSFWGEPGWGRESPSDALFIASVAAVEIIKNKQFSVLLGARLIPLSSTVTFQQHSHFLLRIA